MALRSRAIFLTLFVNACITIGDCYVYQGKKFECDYGVTPEVTISNSRLEDNPNRRFIRQNDVFTTEEFKKYFSKTPFFIIPDKFEDNWYSVFLIMGKANASFQFAWLNVSGYNIVQSPDRKKTKPSRGLKLWDPLYPSAGETYYYEFRIVKQKVQALLPTNGRDVDVPWEYENNVYDQICKDYTDISFYITGEKLELPPGAAKPLEAPASGQHHHLGREGQAYRTEVHVTETKTEVTTVQTEQKDFEGIQMAEETVVQ